MGVTGTGSYFSDLYIGHCLLKYIGFADLDGIVFRKLYVF